MGDPKKARKTIHGPRHPWERERIEEERVLIKEYGLKNKRELWKARSMLKKITAQAKRLLRDKSSEQAKLEKENLLKKLANMNIIQKNTPLEDVLALGVKDILNRRLQTIFHNFNNSCTIKQARQMIVHGHVFINGGKVDIPSYIVLADDEVVFRPNSAFASEEHAEIIKLKKKIMGQVKKEESNVEKEDKDIEKKSDPKKEKKTVKKKDETKKEKKTVEKKEEKVKTKKVSKKEEVKKESKEKVVVKEDKK